jgi:hypothetical protein
MEDVVTTVEDFIFPKGYVEIHCGLHIYDCEDPDEAKLQHLVNQTFGFDDGWPRRWVELVSLNLLDGSITILDCS